ncbi:hypothetical protein DACRYDRAFT_113862 [Dacryopinax primogenitus]|uniref:Uncharacterized protein n=1 Tax=Dacryopinax primogenitus (strain DJM 731) TaxID=1858805 RepID=M5GBN5_DACPD|nr:uncharacterized protein DACRYDRAFT_113862 [Dacryopinax primogenitus]EJU05830.1 hypothetical protein DACRYDRAFT_113862 [Dacryopinax primogenitus]
MATDGHIRSNAGEDRSLPFTIGSPKPRHWSRRTAFSCFSPAYRWRMLPGILVLLLLVLFFYPTHPPRLAPLPGEWIDPISPIARLRNGGPGRRGDGQVCGVRARMAVEGGGWTMSRIREMVAETEGFFVRDWSLHLGWNNMRYIIESGINQAYVLNRTLVLPSYVYARHCELAAEVCGSYGGVLNRTAFGAHLPISVIELYRMPLGAMLDLDIIRAHRNVVLMSEYLDLQDLPHSLEPITGRFSSDLVPQGATVQTIDPWHYDGDLVRVDRLPPPYTENRKWEYSAEVAEQLEVHTHNGMFMQWENGWRVVSEGKGPGFSEQDAEQVLAVYGYSVIHSYTGRRVEHLKFVGFPVKFICVRDRMRGWYDDHGSSPATVFWLQGEVHVERRPGDMWFSTPAARDEYTELVLYTMHRPANILKVASRVDMRIRQLVGGKMWMAVHMRRGDFTQVDWVRVGSIQEHWGRVNERLKQGRALLRELRHKPKETYDVPAVQPYSGWKGAYPPADDDPFFLATDERDPEYLAFLRNHSAILINDLLTSEDRQELGWPIMMTDFLGLLEQAILARSAYFIGRMESSVSGGALNMRAAWGMDPRTMSFE